MREKAEHDIIGGEKAAKKNDIIRGKTAEFLNRKHSEIQGKWEPVNTRHHMNRSFDLI